MAVEIVCKDHAAAIGVSSLGLDESVLDLSSTEALSEVLRRAASFTCPTTERRIVDIAFQATSQLVDSPGLRDRLREVQTEIINVGDLIELEASHEAGGRLVYLGQPSFVRTSENRFLLIGVRPEGAGLLQDELAKEIEPEGHARFLDLEGQHAGEELLIDYGLEPLSRDEWVGSPRRGSPEELVAEFDARLDAARPEAMDFPGATILDPRTSVTYYRGRWRSPVRSDEGRFVGRRPQAYGSDLWTYVELSEGFATRAIDLPVQDALARGCDEAWRLQAALDYRGGNPQVVRARRLTGGETHLVCLYSPLPSWAQRRLDLVGTPAQARDGGLIGYVVPTNELADQLYALKEFLWMVDETDA